MGKRLIVTWHLKTDQVASPTAALIDALAFSVKPPNDRSYVWVVEQMGQFLELGPLEMRRGLFGFRYSARFGEGAGVIAWGGPSQNGKVFFSLMGQGCARVRDWSGLARRGRLDPRSNPLHRQQG